MSFNNITRGGYVSPRLKNQEKLSKDFRNKSVFSEIKTEATDVNKLERKTFNQPKTDMILNSGAYLPAFVLQRQEFNKSKNEIGFKEKKASIRVRPDLSSILNPVIVQNLPVKVIQDQEKNEMLWSDGAYLAASANQQQEHNRKKIGSVPIVIKKQVPISPNFVEKSTVYSDTSGQPQSFSFILSKQKARKIARTVEVLRGTNSEYEIGQQYLADCGFDAHWVYKCAPFKNLPICVENESDGAWVPFIVLYRLDYFECKYVKEEGQGREFSQDHGSAYN